MGPTVLTFSKREKSFPYQDSNSGPSSPQPSHYIVIVLVTGCILLLEDIYIYIYIYISYEAYMAVSFITFSHILLVPFYITVYMAACFVCFCLTLQIMYLYCYVYVFLLLCMFCSVYNSVSLCCSVYCLCVIVYYCHRVSTQLQ